MFTAPNYKIGLGINQLLSFTGFEIYFPVSTIKLAVPTSQKLLSNLDKHPIAHFQIESINRSLDTSHFVYELDNPEDYLEINSHSGDISIGKNFYRLGKLYSEWIYNITFSSISFWKHDFCFLFPQKMIAI